MAEKEFLDPTDFSDPRSALQFSQNAIRQTLRFDAFGGKTIFEAIVLSNPIFLADAQLSDADNTLSVGLAEEGRLTKFSFKGRIIDSPSPHDFLPDPCDLELSVSDKAIAKVMRVTNLHTTFISSDDYTRTNITLPNVGDRVRVELTKNIHSYNLQFGKFVGLATSAPLAGAGEPGEDTCASALVAFSEGQAAGAGGVNFVSISMTPEAGNISDEALKGYATNANLKNNGGCKPADKECARELAKMFLYALRAEQEGRGEGRWATGSDHALDGAVETIGLSKCGGKGSYALADCETFKIAGHSVKLHPTFGKHLKKAVDDAIAAGAVKASQITSIGGGRLTETQIYLRIRYGCGANYTEIMTAASTDKCSTPAAQPTKSNHEVGLATDVAGILTSGGTGAAMEAGSVARQSPFFKWLKKNVHGKDLYGNIKGWLRKEPWHWSWNGG